MAGNSINHEGASAVADALKTNTTLTKLHLDSKYTDMRGREGGEG